MPVSRNRWVPASEGIRSSCSKGICDPRIAPQAQAAVAPAGVLREDRLGAYGSRSKGICDPRIVPPAQTPVAPRGCYAKAACEQKGVCLKIRNIELNFNNIEYTIDISKIYAKIYS